VFGSPTKGRALGYAIAEEGTPAEDLILQVANVEDEELDPRSLLDRMRETVNDMKHCSVVAGTPRVESAASAPTRLLKTNTLSQFPGPPPDELVKALLSPKTLLLHLLQRDAEGRPQPIGVEDGNRRNTVGL
jgi:hypothetical protein